MVQKKLDHDVGGMSNDGKFNYSHYILGMDENHNNSISDGDFD